MLLLGMMKLIGVISDEINGLGEKILINFLITVCILSARWLIRLS